MGSESQAACNDDLLLIPAAQGCDIDIGAAAANSQALYPLGRFTALEETAELPAPPEVAQARDRQVLSQEQIRNQPASRAVSRQQHKTGTQRESGRSGSSSRPPSLTEPRRADSHDQFRNVLSPRAGNTCNAKNSSRGDGERKIVHQIPGESLTLQRPVDTMRGRVTSACDVANLGAIRGVESPSAGPATVPSHPPPWWSPPERHREAP